MFCTFYYNKNITKGTVVYLHIQIIVILQMNNFLNISSCYIWKSYFLEKNKNFIYISSTRMVSNCNKNQMSKSLEMSTNQKRAVKQVRVCLQTPHGAQLYLPARSREGSREVAWSSASILYTLHSFHTH